MHSLINKLTGKTDEAAATTAGHSSSGTTGTHAPSHATTGTTATGVNPGSAGTGLTQTSGAPGSLKTTLGLADEAHSNPLRTGGQSGVKEHSLTSNFGAAQTGDFGGATGNPKPEYNVEAQRGAGGYGQEGSFAPGTTGTGVGTGISAAPQMGTGTGTGLTGNHEHTHSHHTESATGEVLRDSAAGAAVGGGITAGHHHSHEHPQQHQHMQSGNQQYSSGGNIGDAVDRATESHSHEPSHTHGHAHEQTGTGLGHHHRVGEALFDSAPNSAVGGGISGTHNIPGDFGAQGGETQSVPGAAHGGGLDGAGEGYHDRGMGAGMGDYYKGSQAGR